MGLFGKKKPAEFCAVCGKERKTGLLRGLFQMEIDGQYVCSDCFGATDIQTEILNKMSIAEFKAYFPFREENEKLKERFSATSKVELGTWGTELLFDRVNGLMSFDQNMRGTVFQRGSLRSFVIREDDRAIMEGSGEGLRFYESPVQEELRMLGPAFADFSREQRRFEERLRFMKPEQREEAQKNAPRFTCSEPFRNFYAELYFDHPYWNNKTLEMGGPRFDSKDPNAAKYMSEYREGCQTMQTLAQELMAVFFPGAGAPAAAQGVQTDAAEALLKYKELLDMGVITQAEFDAKKRQLLGV